MKSAAIIEYGPDLDKIKSVGPEHPDYMRSLPDGDLLFAAGPFTEHSGAL